MIALCTAPALWLGVARRVGDLGANPIETVEHATGAWALRLLLATLAVTPLRRLAGWQAIATQRRTLGLFAFGYATAHFLTWSVLDNGLDWAGIADDIAKRPFVTVGFAAFVLADSARADVDARVDPPARPALGRSCTAWSTSRRGSRCCTSCGW